MLASVLYWSEGGWIDKCIEGWVDYAQMSMMVNGPMRYIVK